LKRKRNGYAGIKKNVNEWAFNRAMHVHLMLGRERKPNQFSWVPPLKKREKNRKI